jgi:phosphohistidine phosphatase SixA
MRIRCLAVIASCLAFSAVSVSALDVVYVTRHAQKEPSLPWSQLGAFRPLSPKGASCAAQLGKMMQDRGIAAVYSSETERTLATGAAVSSMGEGVRVIGDDRTLEPTPELVRELRQEHAGDQAILIVGHSNTVDDLVLAFRPDVAACLGRLRLTDTSTRSAGIPETQYGDVWRLELGDDQTDCRGVDDLQVGRVGEHDCSTP